MSSEKQNSPYLKAIAASHEGTFVILPKRIIFRVAGSLICFTACFFLFKHPFPSALFRPHEVLYSLLILLAGALSFMRTLHSTQFIPFLTH